jgi:predicted small secreted protein
VKRLLLLSFVCLTAWLVSGCSTLGFGRDIDGNVPLNKAIAEVPENQLLDVWVELFDPGMLPEDEDDAMGLSMDIREAESRYMPEQLRTVMEATGYWGAVRVVPQNTEGAELLVRGTIIESDGQQLELEITALDATGREWFNRNYEEEIEADAYRRNESRDADVFHSLYHAIANDLASCVLPPTWRRIPSRTIFHSIVRDATASHVCRQQASRCFVVCWRYVIVTSC